MLKLQHQFAAYFFCTAHFFCAHLFILHNEIKPEMLLKEKAAAAVRLFEEAADKIGLSLKLRKKTK